MSGLVRRARQRLRPQEIGALASEARGGERYKRIGLTAVASMAARAVGIGTAIVAVPLTIHYLGAEQYGVWITITSVAALLGFGDLGLSNGLMNAVSEADGRGDRDVVRAYISSTVAMLLLVSLVLGIVFAAAYPLVPWPRVFNVSSASAGAVASRALAVFVGITLLSLPLGVVSRIQMGFQEGFKSSLWQAAGSVLSLAALIVAVGVESSLPWLVLAIGGGLLLSTLLNGAALVRGRPWLLPRRRFVSGVAARRILRLGLLFFILQVAYVVAFGIDNIVIAQILGARAVTSYAVPMKLFMAIPMVLGFGLSPLWPAYREALTRKDHSWVRRTLVRSLQIAAGVSTPLSLVLVLIGRRLIELWVGSTVVPSTQLLVALGLYTVVFSMSTAIAMFLNGANVIGFQVALAIGMMLTNLAFSIVLTHVLGVSGPAWGSTIALVLCVLVPSFWYIRRFMRRIGEPAEEMRGAST